MYVLYFELTQSSDVPVDGPQRIPQATSHARHYCESTQAAGMIIWDRKIRNVNGTIVRGYTCPVNELEDLKKKIFFS
jgi:hypothetical protein